MSAASFSFSCGDVTGGLVVERDLTARGDGNFDARRLDFRLLHRRLARRQIDFQVVHHLRRGDDEDHQQHEHEVEQWRDVQLRHRAVTAPRCFLEAHCNTGSVASDATSKRMVTLGGKFVGGGRSKDFTALNTCLTVASHWASPEPFEPNRLNFLCCPADSHSQSLQPRNHHPPRHRAGSISGAMHIPCGLCKSARDRNWSQRPCRRRNQTTASRLFGGATTGGATTGGACTFGASTILGVSIFGGSAFGGSIFGGSGSLGFSGGFSLIIRHGDCVEASFQASRCAPQSKSPPATSNGVERERNHQAHSRRANYVSCAVGIAGAFIF